MPADLTTLTDLTNHRPSNAAEPPFCALCGGNITESVADGVLSDGQAAGFVPVCSDCYTANQKVKEPDK
jgi:hypothetical protein